mgnify:CR=1 FL=1
MCEVGFYKQGETLLRTCCFFSRMSLLQGHDVFREGDFRPQRGGFSYSLIGQIASAEKKHHALQQLYDLIVREIERSD